MAYFNTDSTYGSVAKFLHWTVFTLVLIMLLSGYFMGYIPNKAIRWQITNTHKLLGLLILSLMLFRFIWTTINLKPKLPGDTLWWQRVLERVIHYLIYLALILMPLSGWIMSSAAGKAPILGSLIIKLPMDLNKPRAHLFLDVHFWLAIVIIVLISIHIAAALFHYAIKKDNILQRILPTKSS